MISRELGVSRDLRDTCTGKQEVNKALHDRLVPASAVSCLYYRLCGFKKKNDIAYSKLNIVSHTIAV